MTEDTGPLSIDLPSHHAGFEAGRREGVAATLFAIEQAVEDFPRTGPVISPAINMQQLLDLLSVVSYSLAAVPEEPTPQENVGDWCKCRECVARRATSAVPPAPQPERMKDPEYRAAWVAERETTWPSGSPEPEPLTTESVDDAEQRVLAACADYLEELGLSHQEVREYAEALASSTPVPAVIPLDDVLALIEAERSDVKANLYPGQHDYPEGRNDALDTLRDALVAKYGRQQGGK